MFYDLFGGTVDSNNVFNCFYFLILFSYTTTCFGPYVPSSSGIYSHLWKLLRLLLLLVLFVMHFEPKLFLLFMFYNGASSIIKTLTVFKKYVYMFSF
jgi:hypothetical protein